MDNQHRQIKGYKELSQQQIDLMNKVKELGVSVGELISDLGSNIGDDGVDPRWLSIAKTDLQKGFMELTRAIAKPDFF
jgi:hypothetical protein